MKCGKKLFHLLILFTSFIGAIASHCLAGEYADRWSQVPDLTTIRLPLAHHRNVEEITRRCQAVFASNQTTTNLNCFDDAHHVNQVSADSSGHCCYARAMEQNADRSLTFYRRALRRIHPMIRTRMEDECTIPFSNSELSGFRAGTALIQPRGCSAEYISALKSKIDDIITQSDFTSQSAFDEFIQSQINEGSEISQIYFEECRTPRGVPFTGRAARECFTNLARRLGQELEIADNQMKHHMIRLLRNHRLMYQCVRSSPDQYDTFCLNRDPWEVHHAAPENFNLPEYARWSPQSRATDVANTAPRNSPLDRTGQERGVPTELLTCLEGFGARRTQLQVGHGICDIDGFNQSELGFFRPEIVVLLEQTNAQHYFEILRMEAVSRLMLAYYQLHGEYPQTSAVCRPYAEGFQRMRDQTVDENIRTWHQQSLTPEYRQALQIAARNFLRLKELAQRAAAVPETLLEIRENSRNGGAFIPNPAYPEAQSRLRLVESEMLKTLNSFPFLNTGHNPEAVLYESRDFITQVANASNDRALQELVQTAKDDSRSDLQNTINRYCQIGGEGMSWRDLVQNNMLTNAVLRHFPIFRDFQQCAADKIERNENYHHGVLFMSAVSCIAGGFLIPITGAILCGGAATYESIASYNRAQEQIIRFEECRAAGNRVCSDDNYLVARRDYEAALNAITTNAVFTSIVLAPATLSLLRNAPTFLENAQLLRMAQRLRSAQNVTEAETILADLERLQSINRLRLASGVNPLNLRAMNNPGRAIRGVIGRRLTSEQERTLQRLMQATRTDSATSAEITRQNRLLQTAGFTPDEIIHIREAGFLPRYQVTSGVIAADAIISPVQVATRELDAIALAQLRGESPGNIIQRILGRRVVSRAMRRELDDIFASTSGQGLFTPEQIANQTARLEELGLTSQQISQLRQAGYLTARAPTTQYYMIDANNNMHIVNQIPQVADDAPMFMTVGEGESAQSILVREAGSVHAPDGRNINFRPSYGAELPDDEIAQIIARAESQNPGTRFSRGTTSSTATANSESSILRCADIIAAQGAGSGSTLQRIAADSIVTGVAIGFGEVVLDEGRLDTAEGRAQVASDFQGGLFSQAYFGAVAPRVYSAGMSRPATMGVMYVAGMLYNEFQEQLTIANMEATTDADTEHIRERAGNITAFNNAYAILRTVSGYLTDTYLMQRLPSLLFNACRSGGSGRMAQMSVQVTATSIRIVEKGAWAIIYFGARSRIAESSSEE